MLSDGAMRPRKGRQHRISELGWDGVPDLQKVSGRVLQLDVPV